MKTLNLIIIVIIVLILIVAYVFLFKKKEVKSNQMGSLKLTSSAFAHNTEIPDKYTCNGEDINPELKIENVPNGTKSLVLIMEDPDAPLKTWVHWVMWNIPPTTKKIKENSKPTGAIQGKNSWGKNKYGGPCPPSGTHRYVFKLYALDTNLNLDANSEKKDVEKSIQGHILAKTELIGLYSKK